MPHEKALVCSLKLHRRRIVVKSASRTHSREEQLDVVLAEFIGQQVSHWSVWPANQLTEDIPRTSHTNEETHEGSFPLALCEQNAFVVLETDDVGETGAG